MVLFSILMDECMASKKEEEAHIKDERSAVVVASGLAGELMRQTLPLETTVQEISLLIEQSTGIAAHDQQVWTITDDGQDRLPAVDG